MKKYKKMINNIVFILLMCCVYSCTDKSKLQHEWTTNGVDNIAAQDALWTFSNLGGRKTDILNQYLYNNRQIDLTFSDQNKLKLFFNEESTIHYFDYAVEGHILTLTTSDPERVFNPSQYLISFVGDTLKLKFIVDEQVWPEIEKNMESLNWGEAKRQKEIEKMKNSEYSFVRFN